MNTRANHQMSMVTIQINENFVYMFVTLFYVFYKI